MRSQRITPPSRAKAIAIESNATERELALIHLLLALMAPLLIMALTGCKSNDTGETVSFGPEVANDALNEALIAPILETDPLTMKVGQFIHFSTSQQLAGGAVNTLLADTGQTVIDSVETAADITFTIVQHTLVYNNDQAQKTSVEFKFGFEKPDTQSSSASSAGLNAFGVAGGQLSPLAALQAGLAKYDMNGKATTFSSVVQAAERVTFHDLKTSTTVEKPPVAVQNESNCLGIPSCQIKVHRVSFDQVFWSGDKGERIHFDLAMSPDVPVLAGMKMSPLFEYYPGLIKSCVTLMVPVGDGRSKTLLTECNQLENFRFEAAPQQKP